MSYELIVTSTQSSLQLPHTLQNYHENLDRAHSFHASFCFKKNGQILLYPLFGRFDVKKLNHRSKDIGLWAKKTSNNTPQMNCHLSSKRRKWIIQNSWLIFVSFIFTSCNFVSLLVLSFHQKKHVERERKRGREREQICGQR